MLSEQKQVITRHWMDLMQISEVQALANALAEKGVFTKNEIKELFSTKNERHDRRMFFFVLQEKGETAFFHLVQWLFSMGHNKLANLLSPKSSGCSPFRLPEDDEEEDERTSSIETEFSLIPTDNNTTPLNVQVKLSEEFFDSKKHNPNLEFYSCRSKQRGRILIINNYEFAGNKHEYRNGAIVDEQNLEKLFNQMGGWVVEKHSNKTVEEMRLIVKDFVKFKKEKICDICFVFIMSHGSEQLNKTIIFGKDGKHIHTSEIQNYFTNEKCSLFRSKPKVFIHQVCRGQEKDLPVRHTETDGKFNCPEPSSLQEPMKPVIECIRPVDDMLVGYPTLHGSKAHRDPNRGTWYIELFCQNFMQYAKNESVDHLLMMVDGGLRRRMSEYHTMQTSEIKNKGFKKLYLNPGIYEENRVLKRF